MLPFDLCGGDALSVPAECLIPWHEALASAGCCMRGVAPEWRGGEGMDFDDAILILWRYSPHIKFYFIGY